MIKGESPGVFSLEPTSHQEPYNEDFSEVLSGKHFEMKTLQKYRQAGKDITYLYRILYGKTGGTVPARAVVPIHIDHQPDNPPHLPGISIPQ